ncbi:hypothetical protein GIB67_017861 [Kingdonia uniflora]|uniref:Pentatricopeptide repeat-containing protein n=1 Tax=Kingdonia uniflora TaxID=39325 RepID=A0A7J7MKU6_9MAGN|nr:hypothetical protein GIB67_017861 [Kingdonia uniflora]
MKQVGVPPSVSFLNVFIKALYLKKETVDDALQVFREIPDHGCIPDSYTYGTLINGLCKLGKISEAKELFEEMDAKDCSPTVVTYTSLIHGSCLSNILDEAMELFEEMSRKGIEPNMVTFSSLMDGLCKGGRSLQALKLREKMIGKRFSTNTIIYNNLVSGLCKEGKVPDAEVANLLDEMVPGGIFPIHVSWSLQVNSHNMVVSGLCTEKDLNRAFQINLNTRTKHISVDSETYKYLVGCFSKKGDVYKVSQIVNEMLLEGSIPDEWNAVVCGFLHRTKVKEAADVVYVELIGNFLETRTMKGVLFHAEETSVFNMKEQVFTKVTLRFSCPYTFVFHCNIERKKMDVYFKVVVAYACKRQLAGQACAPAVGRTRAILMEMLDQSGGASSIAGLLTTSVVNGTSLTLPTLPILGLTLLGLALDPSLVGLSATSQSIPVLIVPEGFYSVIVDEVIREEAYLFVESRTLGDISTGEVEAWLKIFTIIHICKVNIDRGDCTSSMGMDLSPQPVELIEQGRIVVIAQAREFMVSRPPVVGESVADIPRVE